MRGRWCMSGVIQLLHTCYIGGAVFCLIISVFERFMEKVSLRSPGKRNRIPTQL